MNDYVMLRIARTHHAELVREADQRRLARLARSRDMGVTRTAGRVSFRAIAIVLGGVLVSSALLMVGLDPLPRFLG